MREITSVFARSDDLVLEILKNVQANVALLRDDMASVKAGITSMRTDGRDAYGARGTSRRYRRPVGAA